MDTCRPTTWTKLTKNDFIASSIAKLHIFNVIKYPYQLNVKSLRYKNSIACTIIIIIIILYPWYTQSWYI